MTAQPDHARGVMVAVPIPLSHAERVALPDGTTPGEMHCTLAYLGHADELSDEQARGVVDAAHAAARATPPLYGSFPTGHGVFDNADERPLWLHPDVPGLSALRERLVAELAQRGHGGLVHSEHGFTPHVTAKYLTPDEELPQEHLDSLSPEPLAVTHLLVSIGPDEQLVPLTGTPVTASARPRRSRADRVITPAVDGELSQVAARHNRRAPLGQLASLPMLRAVYRRGMDSPASRAPASSRHALAMRRVREFTLALTLPRSPHAADLDLMPAPVPRSLLAEAIGLADSHGADEVLSLLTASAFSMELAERQFNLSRALALASSAPSLDLLLGGRLRALVADGNSSLARSLRARKQLRDRHGQWIEMGGGIRFKVRAPGAPGGGTWYHGVVQSQDVPNGRVNVKLDDGHLVNVPASKVEKTLATIPEPNALEPGGTAPVPDDQVDGIPEDDVQAHPDGAPAPAAAGEPPSDREVAAAASDAVDELEARVTDSSSAEAKRARDAGVKGLLDNVKKLRAGSITPSEAKQALQDDATTFDAAVSSAPGMSDSEREHLRSFAEDMADISAAMDAPDVAEARLPEAAPEPAPEAATPQTGSELDDLLRQARDLAGEQPEDAPLKDNVDSIANVVENVNNHLKAGDITPEQAHDLLDTASKHIDAVITELSPEQAVEDDLVALQQEIDSAGGRLLRGAPTPIDKPRPTPDERQAVDDIVNSPAPDPADFQPGDRRPYPAAVDLPEMDSSPQGPPWVGTRHIGIRDANGIPKRLFHATSPENVERILQDGLEPGDGGVHMSESTSTTGFVEALWSLGDGNSALIEVNAEGLDGLVVGHDGEGTWMTQDQAVPADRVKLVTHPYVRPGEPPDNTKIDQGWTAVRLADEAGARLNDLIPDDQRSAELLRELDGFFDSVVDLDRVDPDIAGVAGQAHAIAETLDRQGHADAAGVMREIADGMDRVAALPPEPIEAPRTLDRLRQVADVDLPDEDTLLSWFNQDVVDARERLDSAEGLAEFTAAADDYARAVGAADPQLAWARDVQAREAKRGQRLAEQARSLDEAVPEAPATPEPAALLRTADVDMERPELTGDQRAAVNEFRLPDNAVAINEALRAGQPLDQITDDFMQPGDEGYYQDLHDQMLQISEQSRLNAPVTLWRGLRADREYQQGEVLRNEGWSSTSLNRATAQDFVDLDINDGRRHDGVPTLMQVDAPEGAHLVNTLEDDVAELILPPGSEFEVLDTLMVDGVNHVHVSVHAQGAPSADAVPERPVEEQTSQGLTPDAAPVTPLFTLSPEQRARALELGVDTEEGQKFLTDAALEQLGGNPPPQVTDEARQRARDIAASEGRKLAMVGADGHPIYSNHEVPVELPSGETIQVDEQVADLVRRLNANGQATTFSGGGHLASLEHPGDYSPAYVALANEQDVLDLHQANPDITTYHVRGNADTAGAVYFSPFRINDIQVPGEAPAPAREPEPTPADDAAVQEFQQQIDDLNADLETALENIAGLGEFNQAWAKVTRLNDAWSDYQNGLIDRELLQRAIVDVQPLIDRQFGTPDNLPDERPLDISPTAVPPAPADPSLTDPAFVAPEVERGRDRLLERVGVTQAPALNITELAHAPAQFDHRRFGNDVIDVDPRRADQLVNFRENDVFVNVPTSVWEYAGAHETGHYLASLLPEDRQLDLLRAGAEAAGLEPPRPDDHLGSIFGWAQRTEMGEDVRRQQGEGPLAAALSTYGTWNDHEAIGEALAEYALAASPRPFAQAVGDALKQELTDRGVAPSEVPLASDSVVRDQFEQPVPDGFTRVDAPAVEGMTNMDVELWDAPPGTEGDPQFRVWAVRANRRGRTTDDQTIGQGEPVYVIRDRRTRAAVGNYKTWDAVSQAVDRLRAEDAPQRAQVGDDAQARARQEADRIAQARADAAERAGRNVDDHDRPLPDGWEREVTDTGDTVFRGPGPFIAMEDAAGGLALMRRQGGDLLYIGGFDAWPDLANGIDVNLDDLARQQRIQAANVLERLGQPDLAALARTEPSAQAVRDAVEQSDWFKSLEEQASDAAGADRQSAEQSRVLQDYRSLQNVAVGLRDVRAPEPSPTPAPPPDDIPRRVGDVIDDQEARDAFTAWLGGDATALHSLDADQVTEIADAVEVVRAYPGNSPEMAQALTQILTDLEVEARGAGVGQPAPETSGTGEDTQAFLAVTEVIRRTRDPVVRDAFNRWAVGSPDALDDLSPAQFQDLLSGIEGANSDAADQGMRNSYGQLYSDVLSIMEEQAAQARAEAAPPEAPATPPAPGMSDVMGALRAAESLEADPDYPGNWHDDLSDVRADVLAGNLADAADQADHMGLDALRDALAAAQPAAPTPTPAEEPPAPEPPAAPAPAQPLPGANLPGYHRDNIHQFQDGSQLKAGDRVLDARGEPGLVTAIQNQPPYARVTLDDGRVVLRSARTLRRPEPVEVPGYNAPGAPAAPAPAPAPAPALADTLPDEWGQRYGLDGAPVQVGDRVHVALWDAARDTWVVEGFVPQRGGGGVGPWGVRLRNVDPAAARQSYTVTTPAEWRQDVTRAPESSPSSPTPTVPEPPPTQPPAPFDEDAFRGALNTGVNDGDISQHEADTLIAWNDGDDSALDGLNGRELSNLVEFLQERASEDPSRQDIWTGLAQALDRAGAAPDRRADTPSTDVVRGQVGDQVIARVRDLNARQAFHEWMGGSEHALDGLSPQQLDDLISGIDAAYSDMEGEQRARNLLMELHDQVAIRTVAARARAGAEIGTGDALQRQEENNTLQDWERELLEAVADARAPDAAAVPVRQELVDPVREWAAGIDRRFGRGPGGDDMQRRYSNSGFAARQALDAIAAGDLDQARVSLDRVVFLLRGNNYASDEVRQQVVALKSEVMRVQQGEPVNLANRPAPVVPEPAPAPAADERVGFNADDLQLAYERLADRYDQLSFADQAIASRVLIEIEQMSSELDAGEPLDMADVQHLAQRADAVGQAPAAPAAPPAPARWDLDRNQLLRQLREEFPRRVGGARAGLNVDLRQAGFALQFAVHADRRNDFERRDREVARARQLLTQRRRTEQLQRLDTILGGAPAAPAAPANGISEADLKGRAQSILDMHSQGQRAGYPLLPGNASARQSLEEFIQAVDGGDISDAAEAASRLGRIIQSYEAALQHHNARGDVRTATERRLAAAQSLLADVNSRGLQVGAAPDGAPGVVDRAGKPDFLPRHWLDAPAPSLGERALDDQAPGVQDPYAHNVHLRAPAPEAAPSDYLPWTARAGEVAAAARSRVSHAALFDDNIHRDERRVMLAQAFGDYGDDPPVRFGSDGYSVKVTSSDAYPGYWSVHGSIRNNDGQPIGSFHRSYDGTANSVYNASMSITAPNTKGAGFATAFNRHMENWYIANGISEVKVSAAGGGGSDGGRAWALNGFNWRGTSVSSRISAVQSALRVVSREASTPGEQAAVKDLKARIRLVENDNSLADEVLPTPMELALVGWRPGLKRFAGSTAMARQSWSGVKHLTPNAREYRQYEAKRRARGVESGISNSPKAPELSADFLSRFAGATYTDPDLQAARSGIASALARRDRLGFIPQPLQRKLAGHMARLISDKRARREFGDPLALGDIAKLHRALLDEDRRLSPDLGLPAHAQPLLTASARDLRADSVPGFTATQVHGGVSVTYRVTHNATGQVFFVKAETRTGRQSEVDFNLLYRLAGFPGVPEFDAHQTDENLVVMQRVGDGIDLQSRPTGLSNAHTSVDALADPGALVGMWLADVASGNYDRHGQNFMVAQDHNSRWWVLPVDQGRAGVAGAIDGGGFGVVTARSLAGVIASVTRRNSMYQNLSHLRGQMGGAQFEAYIEEWIARYRAALEQGNGAYSTEFVQGFINSLAVIEAGIDQVVP